MSEQINWTHWLEGVRKCGFEVGLADDDHTFVIAPALNKWPPLARAELTCNAKEIRAILLEERGVSDD